MFSFVLALPALAGSASEDQPLKVKLTTLTQRHCRGDGDVWAIWLKLQLQTTNITGKKLIVQKTIGRAWYSPIVARDEKGLPEDNFDEAPSREFMPTESEIRGPSQDALGKELVILSPGESFEAESNVDVLVGAGAPSLTNKGLIGPETTYCSLDWPHGPMTLLQSHFGINGKTTGNLCTRW